MADDLRINSGDRAALHRDDTDVSAHGTNSHHRLVARDISGESCGSLKNLRIALPAEPKHHSPLRWLNNQPYLLLSLTSLFWAGNIVLARYVAGHVPPMTLSCISWIGAFVMLLPFALAAS